MLKVGLITTEFLPVWGGISSYSMNLCKGLADKVEFHVLTTSSALDHTSLSQEESRIIEKVKIHAISPAAGVALPSLRYQLALMTVWGPFQATSLLMKITLLIELGCFSRGWKVSRSIPL